MIVPDRLNVGGVSFENGHQLLFLLGSEVQLLGERRDLLRLANTSAAMANRPMYFFMIVSRCFFWVNRCPGDLTMRGSQWEPSIVTGEGEHRFESSMARLTCSTDCWRNSAP
jgi:hypothetical protein